LINLILAIVALSYKDQQIKAFEEAANEERIKAVNDLFLFLRHLKTTFYQKMFCFYKVGNDSC